MPPLLLLDEIRDQAGQMATDKQACWKDVLKPALKKKNILLKKLKSFQRRIHMVKILLSKRNFPCLNPLAVDPTHPFPFILNKSLNIIVALKTNGRKKRKLLMAIVPVPRILPRLV
jgi:polyphosphate kinase